MKFPRGSREGRISSKPSMGPPSGVKVWGPRVEEVRGVGWMVHGSLDVGVMPGLGGTSVSRCPAFQ